MKKHAFIVAALAGVFLTGCGTDPNEQQHINCSKGHQEYHDGSVVNLCDDFTSDGSTGN